MLFIDPRRHRKQGAAIIRWLYANTDFPPTVIEFRHLHVHQTTVAITLTAEILPDQHPSQLNVAIITNLLLIILLL